MNVPPKPSWTISRNLWEWGGWGGIQMDQPFEPSCTIIPKTTYNPGTWQDSPELHQEYNIQGTNGSSGTNTGGTYGGNQWYSDGIDGYEVDMDFNSFYNQHPDDLALQYGDYSDLDANEQVRLGAFREFARGTGFAAPPIGNHPGSHFLPPTDRHARRPSPNPTHHPDSMFCPGNVSGPVSGAGFTNQAPFAASSGPPHPGPGFDP